MHFSWFKDGSTLKHRYAPPGLLPRWTMKPVRPDVREHASNLISILHYFLSVLMNKSLVKNVRTASSRSGFNRFATGIYARLSGDSVP
jgi:hypothetical protein